ncbi:MULTISPECIES: hypothetical protein [unclassified Pseudoalteromonas]|uniref:hypothetical protein n=1 Tax=unclassified Pseudoalteromonas TaxID=194690 RepID=UPI000F64D0AE|nr:MULTISPECIES: hypothetical protein [unclassified Pseudoalteromonas]RRS06975.1 hypothetical protein EAG18_19525 [Pseudoalteromonas sp. J010]RXE98406.1 hypothetical protein D9603_17145 [Pseudoalteromonas sp. PS5]USD27687.1 hypothetical protein J8Z24_12090 [Pseudoalteromonas sp. SCSIO 43201]
MQQHIVEIVKFKLAISATEQDLMRVNTDFAPWIEQQPGLLYRSLSKDDQTDEYIDVFYWQSLAHAQAVSEQFPTTEVCKRLMQYTNSESVSISRSHIVTQTQCSG